MTKASGRICAKLTSSALRARSRRQNLRVPARGHHPNQVMKRIELLITSIAPCVSCAPASGIGNRRTPTGTRSSGGPSSSCSTGGIDLAGDFLFFAPLSVPDELRDGASAVVLTAPYHERDARRLGLPV